MNLLYVMPQLKVVPPEAAYPGYGTLVELRDANHINVCKPEHRGDPGYHHTLEFLQQRVAEIHARRRAKQAGN